MFQEVVKAAPSIIQEAAKSPLGIAALSILAVSIVGFFFFRNESTKVKVFMFILLSIAISIFCFSLILANKSFQSEILRNPDGNDVEIIKPTPKITPTPIATPTVTQTAKPITQSSEELTVEKNGVSYKLVEAKFEGNELVFWLIANNSGANKEACLYYSTSLIDEQGNPHRQIDFISGKVRGGMDCFWVGIPSNVPTRFGIIFNTVSPSTKKIPLLTIVIQKEGALEFRNISLPFSKKN